MFKRYCLSINQRQAGDIKHGNMGETIYFKAEQGGKRAMRDEGREPSVEGPEDWGRGTGNGETGKRRRGKEVQIPDRQRDGGVLVVFWWCFCKPEKKDG
jgi:hypothetical protein